jgi:hypothetical protein
MEPRVFAVRPYWRKLQWFLIGLWILATPVLAYFDAQQDKNFNPWGCSMVLLAMLVQGSWITLDCWLNNRRVDAWRFGAILLGPLAIWAWLVKAYGVRAALWIPVSILIYAAPIGLLVLAEALGLITAP